MSLMTCVLSDDGGGVGIFISPMYKYCLKWIYLVYKFYHLSEVYEDDNKLGVYCNPDSAVRWPLPILPFNFFAQLAANKARHENIVNSSGFIRINDEVNSLMMRSTHYLKNIFPCV